MNRKLATALAAFALLATTHVCAQGAELLLNGDFEIGPAEEKEPKQFIAQGWRRQLWRPETRKSWLSNGVYDARIGKDNQALIFAWGATSIYQEFSAAAGNEYAFSIDHMMPDSARTRWESRVRVEWYNASGKRIGPEVIVAQADKAKTPSRKWTPLSGRVSAPPATAYGRVLLDIVNSGGGNYFQRTYIDNASVTGKPGTDNLPVSFRSAPYDFEFDPIDELSTLKGTLTDYADDGDGDRMTFTKLSGPDWLKINPDGAFSGTPDFADVGESVFSLKVKDGRGASDTRSLTVPVVGLLRFSNLFSDHMVIQRGYKIAVWGVALPDSPVAVQLRRQRIQTTSDAQGAWSVELPSMKVGGPYDLTVVSDERKATLTDIMIGDVWFCSGQSNMSWPLKNTDGAEEEIANSINAGLRFVTTPDTTSAEPWTELDARASWLSASPETVGDFSAVGYYFGKNLQADLDIPIGLICSSRGGTSIETWVNGLSPAGRKTRYNSAVHPYTRMAIKGMIWYQAEANIRDGAAYTGKMVQLANEWREAWGVGDFPLYFVQLAPNDYKGDEVLNLPRIWAAQAAAMEQIANCGMVVVNDIATIDNIHPKNKAPVGARLARWAKHDVYGMGDVIPCGPVFQKLEREGAELRVRFDYAGKGLAARDGEALTWFEVAGKDGAFARATAVIDGDSVIVSAPSVKEPQRVRFAWHEIAEPNLINSEGLPVGAFEAGL